jgi:hypothetical protein
MMVRRKQFLQIHEDLIALFLPHHAFWVFSFSIQKPTVHSCLQIDMKRGLREEARRETGGDTLKRDRKEGRGER